MAGSYRLTTSASSPWQISPAAAGVFSPRWRPLQDGPVAGCFAIYGMDGQPTPNSEVAAEMARWTNAPEQADLLRAKPVRGDIGILVVPESQVHCYAKNDSTEYYYKTIGGVYQGFLFNNIQPDFVAIDDLGPEHSLLYLPYPVMLTKETTQRLKGWVADGGRLISEGCPAYFGHLGRIGEHQPQYGLDQVFGVSQQDIQFTPDLLEALDVMMDAGIGFGADSICSRTHPPRVIRSGTLRTGASQLSITFSATANAAYRNLSRLRVRQFTERSDEAVLCGPVELGWQTAARYQQRLPNHRPTSHRRTVQVHLGCQFESRGNPDGIAVPPCGKASPRLPSYPG